jgi:hypothetical protein
MKMIVQFVKQYLILLIILVPSLIFVHQFDAQKTTVDLSIFSSLLFTLQSVILFILLKISVKNPNKQLFLSFTLMNMLVKMVASIILLLVYKELYKPFDGKFIIPFLVVYFLFTIFETFFMLKLANQKP